RAQYSQATVRQGTWLEAARADSSRLAADNARDAAALAEVRKARPNANLLIDLQENYRLAEKVAPFVQKLPYNPCHLHHIERDKPIREKVQHLVEVAREHGCEMRIGDNSGSVDPAKLDRYPKND